MNQRRRQTGAAPSTNSKPSNGVRLHKFMADAGIASRRACEEMIAEGRVTVNNEVRSKPPIWVQPGNDVVAVDGRNIGARPTGRHTYLMVYKTRGAVCTNSDPQGRKKIIDFVPHPQRLFCVGRLDAESTGLVLLTDDGELANHLTHPKYEVPKTYEVTVKGKVDHTAVEKLNKGIWLADKEGKSAKAKAAGVRIMKSDRDKTFLHITLREGRNREIRRMLARLGFDVKRLKRIAIGPLKLKGLAAGNWRELTQPEVTLLRRASKKS